MDLLFEILFPLFLLTFISFDWTKLRRSSLGIKSFYLLLIAASASLFGIRAAGIEPTTPFRFFIEHVSPAVETVFGLK